MFFYVTLNAQNNKASSNKTLSDHFFALANRKVLQVLQGFFCCCFSYSAIIAPAVYKCPALIDNKVAIFLHYNRR